MCCDVDCLDAASLAFIVGCQEPDNMQHQPQLPRFCRLAAAATQIIALVDDPSKVHCSITSMCLTDDILCHLHHQIVTHFLHACWAEKSALMRL